ncbi:MAG TPA: pyruvate ferredoxin oxidoreductase [Acidiferrobacteraceae bacterium]|nr:pyruvate ferredoxin oxidoreductase [Acidiferrobacteraceae bacterium]
MTENKEFPSPGTATTTDGSGAVVWVEAHISEAACAYPITPSTGMGNGYQLAVANGQSNLWNQPLFFLEPESEHSAASSCEGYALAGGRVTNFSSGQGLVLMTEVLYTLSGKRLPVVFHIGARALTSHSLNVHAGHDDVMSVADTGWGMLFARNAQEAHDLALIARRAAESSFTPFMNIQDGFLTTHTIEKVFLAEPEMMAEYVGEPHAHLISLFDPEKPLMTGVVQNQDAYMKGKVAQRFFYDQVPDQLQEAFHRFHELTGRHYDFVGGYQLDDAEYAIVGMGSVMDTAIAAVDWMRKNKGWKVGALNITAFRPFPGKHIINALKNCQAVSIIERMDNPLAKDNPLTTEVKASFADAATGTEGYHKIDALPRIHSGVYGLGSRDTRVGDLIAVTENMVDQGRRFFSLAIEHPTALPRIHNPDVRPSGAFSMRGHSIGGYGSVTTNKIIASLVEDIFGLYVQAYPKYGSEKKGLPTTYYLTVAKQPIFEHSELNHVEFVPLNDVNGFVSSNPLEGLVDGGCIFIQSRFKTDAEVWAHIPAAARKTITDRSIRVLYLDTVKIAKQVAHSADLQLRMQGVVLLGIFLRVAPFVNDQALSETALFDAIKRTVEKYFGRRGEQVVQDNMTAIRFGYHNVNEIDFPGLINNTNSVTKRLHTPQ